VLNVLKQFAQTCSDGSFLGFPAWYRGLDRDDECGASISQFSDVWVVVANLVEIVTRLAALIAIVMIIVGGIMFVTSRGEPDQTKRARDTIINAVLGLIIAILATVIVSFIASRF
jgi:hypothetical protein